MAKNGDWVKSKEGWTHTDPRVQQIIFQILRSAVAQTVVGNGILSTRTGTTSLLEIEFDGNRRKERVDFRPHLPLVFQL